MDQNKNVFLIMCSTFFYHLLNHQLLGIWILPNPLNFALVQAVAQGFANFNSKLINRSFVINNKPTYVSP